jgi:hypothetical protein
MIAWLVASSLLLAEPVTADGAASNKAAAAEKNAATAAAAAVRIVVDTSETPDLAEWGKKAGDIARVWRPKIAELLRSDGEKPYDEVTIVFKNNRPGVAAASAATITISADWVRQHPDDFGMVVHELTHVVQRYPPNKAGWLVEGIADYVRYFHYEPQKKFGPLDPEKASYKQGYGTAARFLDWLERKKPGLVRRLNGALREGRYDDGLFEEHAGKKVDELWKEFLAER